MITTDKALGYPERLTADRRPVTADLFLTRRCNNNCSYCTYTRHMRRSGDDMSPETFDRVAERLMELGVQGVILTGGGDPTCSGCFDHACEWMDDAGLRYGINTNFNLYKECRPAYLKVSLDGWSEDSYGAARGVRAYRRTRENIERYAEWRDANSSGTSIVVQMVAKSADDVMRFYEANWQLPFDAMVFRPVESCGGEWFRNCPRPLDIRKRAEELAAMDPRVVVNPKFWQTDVRFASCSGNHLQLAVDERARVLYCCHKPYEVVGSLFDADILDKKAAYATDMGLCDVPCRLTSSNLLVDMANAIREGSESCFI